MTAVHEKPAEIETQRPGGRGRLITGMLMVIVGGVWLADRAGVVEIDSAMVLPVGLMAIGMALLVGWRDQAHGGLIGAGVLLAVVALVSSVAVPIGPIGDRQFSPTVASDIPDSYQMTAGALELDLSQLDVTEVIRVSARVGFGQIVVTIPEGVAVVVEGHALMGQLSILGTTDDGLGISRKIGEGDPERMLVLDLTVVAGEIDVTEVPRG